MPHMSCPRCGLTVALRAPYLTLERCPRCVAKARIAVPMFITADPRESDASPGATTAFRTARERSGAHGEAVAGALVIRTRREGHALVMSLYGELDLASAPVLEQQLHDAHATGLDRVVVDLSELEFLDSAGLHVLLDAQLRGQKFVLRRGPRAVQRLFELTMAGSVLQFED